MTKPNFDSMAKIQFVGNGKSFGCGPDNPHGLQMTYYTDGKSVYSKLSVKDHLCGWKNIAHGGVAIAILDEVQFWAAFVFTRKLPLAVNVNVNLEKPVPADREIVAKGYIQGPADGKEIITKGEIYSGDDLCTSATNTFKALPVALAKRLKLFDGSDLEWAQSQLKEFESIEN
ncbi:MAG: PaaI family thioesterase [Desulfobacteraceae bacterium]|nr:PaaI family thioesterase [Desulfobacteraceae bacterium]